MKITIDTSPLESGHKGRGVGTYTRNLMETLEKTKTDLSFLFTSEVTKQDTDLIHYPYFDLFFHTLPIKKKTKTIVTIHDVIPLNYPTHFRPGIKGSFRFLLQKQALKSVDHIITDSEASKTDIQSHLDISSNQISVIYLGADKSFKPISQNQITRFKKKFDLPEKFLAYVGDINYNKNIPGLIQAMKYIDIPLVIVTRADLNQTIPEVNAIHSAIKENNFADHIRFIQLPEQTDLIDLYNSCTFYIQPSLHEGFGLPVLEAMQSGAPILCAKAGSLPEVAGKAALYFDPTKTKSIVQTIKSGLSLNSKERTQLAQKGISQAEKFSWEKAAKETITVYKQVLNQ